MGALRRVESGTAESSRDAPPRPASTTGRMAEVVWVYEGAVCVKLLDEPRRGFHDHICRCGGCQAWRHADPAEYFLPDDDGG